MLKSAYVRRKKFFLPVTRWLGIQQELLNHWNNQAHTFKCITNLTDVCSKPTCKVNIFLKKHIRHRGLAKFFHEDWLQHLSRIWLWQDQVRLPSKIVRTLHASLKQSALHKLIKCNHTTLKRKTARYMLFHLISPSPYTIRNLPQLLQPTDFCVQKHRGEKKDTFRIHP